MKKLISLLIVGIFLIGTISCAGFTGRGAGIGAGAGTIASVIAGKSGSTAALLIMGGALLGGAVGLAMDEQAKAASLQPENRGKSVIIVEETPTNKTECSKVTKKTWKDGNLISNTTEEVCRGERQSNSYE